jgi:hypothetical protein
VTPPGLLPYDRDAACPACGIQVEIHGLCRERHAMTPADGSEHLHVACPGCGWEAVMETASAAALRSPSEVPAALRGFLGDGRLLEIPIRSGRRRQVLRHIAARAFEPGRTYPEREVNGTLATWHPDVATLRRYLVDEGFMRRDHGVYELLPAEAWRDAG